MKTVVIGGGRSSEHDVSLQSAVAVRKGLRGQGHEVHNVEIATDGTWRHGDEPLSLEPGKGLLEADVVFPVLHGPYGEDGTVQGLLELLDVPYVGSGLHASATCMDKAVFKEWMAHHGVPQVRYVTLRAAPTAADRRAIEQLGLPVFVKPSRLGSSVGIGKVDEWDGLDAALTEAFRHDSVVLVEAGSPGREIEVAVLGVTDLLSSPPGEIIIRKGDWYDYEAKYTDGGMELSVPADLPAGTAAEVRKLAERAFRLTGCSGMARVDFFVEDGDARGSGTNGDARSKPRVLMNELNTIPGFTEHSVYPKLMAAAGVPFGELLDRLLEDARADFRHARQVEH